MAPKSGWPKDKNYPGGIKKSGMGTKRKGK